MKQVIQNYKSGKLELADVPIPSCSSNMILVKNISSLISIGTEKSIIDLAKKSLLGKAKSRPDLVKRFLDKAKKEGFVKTFKEALGRLDNPTPLGYSSAGIVVEVGKNVNKYSPGDRVACIGAGYASHAEYITVPENLCSRIPHDVDFEEASFGMLGIIAMHGVRCTKHTYGEKIAVIGLGLLGLLTIQILNAYGAEVFGYDINESKIELAKELGFNNMYNNIEDFISSVERNTDGFGADSVIITASTKSNEPINLAMEIARMKARIVVVGVADIHPDRNEMWHKELEIIVSKAGGPGVFDPFYENKGIDYPLPYVRWTENRNLNEFLRLISQKKVDVKKLITHRFKIDEAIDIYNNILKSPGDYVGVILNYGDLSNYVKPINIVKKIIINEKSKKIKSEKINVGVIGAGLFGKALLLPALKNVKNVYLHTIATSKGINAYHIGKKYAFKNITTDYREIIDNPNIDATIILTPHSLHKKMVIESLSAGKHTYVEKPLCINEKELEQITEVYNKLNNNIMLMVGYNRRFSPHSKKIKEFIINRKDPLVMHYRVNPGFIPSTHWVHSEEEGGSRIIGEICHFLDLFLYFTESTPVKVFAERVSGNNESIVNSDNVSIIVKFIDGSIGNIFYSASGDKAFSRERIEIFSEGKSIVLNDFKRLEFYFNGKKKVYKTSNQEMGYKEELKYFFDLIRGKTKQILSYEEIYWSTLLTFKINESLEKGLPVNLLN